MGVTSPQSIHQAIRSLADLFDLRGSRVEAGDLRRAADSLRSVTFADLVHLSSANRLAALPGVSGAARSILAEMCAGGVDRTIQRARVALPCLLRLVLERNVLSPTELLDLVRHTGIATLDDVLMALDDGRLERDAGPELARRLRAAAHEMSAEAVPLTLARAWDVVDALSAEITALVRTLTTIEPAGAIRRCDTLIPSIVLVGQCGNPAEALDELATLQSLDHVALRTARRIIVSYRQTEVDIRVAAPDEFGSVLFAATGSRDHCRAVLAQRKRTSLRATEEMVYADAGLPWIPPELRENTGEIEAAKRGALPVLIERKDIRGDLHMHTTWSDGRDSTATMIQACVALGYEYIAITDHSQNASASKTLSAADVPRQREEIERLRDLNPGIVILHGVEVDILPGGDLDFPDHLLEQFDIVLASLHEDLGHDRARLTKRCLAAIRHPLVNVLTHPSNQLPGRRAGYPLDFDAIYAAAAETGTALEVDGAPGHLDLDGEHAREALRAGVTLVVDSDCHRAAALDRQMRFGVGLARRGWAQPQQVLNTRPMTDLLSFIGVKRL
jgi:DNA polymerase (family 10)